MTKAGISSSDSTAATPGTPAILVHARVSPPLSLHDSITDITPIPFIVGDCRLLSHLAALTMTHMTCFLRLHRLRSDRDVSLASYQTPSPPPGAYSPIIQLQ